MVASFLLFKFGKFYLVLVFIKSPRVDGGLFLTRIIRYINSRIMIKELFSFKSTNFMKSRSRSMFFQL